MASIATATFGLAALVAVGGPVAVVWKVQDRAVKSHREAAATGTEKDEPLVFNGFPYLKVPAGALRTPGQVAAFEELVKANLSKLGPTHPDTLISRNNLANALLADGRYVDAEAVQRKLLVDMKNSLPDDHPDTFRCQFNLALNLRMQGKTEDARSEMETVYAGWKSVLGEGHPRTQEAFLVLQNLRSPGPVTE